MFLKKNKINTPAVTKVEEWTKAETGVGAAIAAGNQDINGNCALLVILKKKSINLKKNILFREKL